MWKQRSWPILVDRLKLINQNRTVETRLYINVERQERLKQYRFGWFISPSAKSSSPFRQTILPVAFLVWPESVSECPLTRVPFFHPFQNAIAYIGFAFLPGGIAAAPGRIRGFDTCTDSNFSDARADLCIGGDPRINYWFYKFPLDIEPGPEFIRDLNIGGELELSISFSLAPLSLGARAEFRMNPDKGGAFLRVSNAFTRIQWISNRYSSAGSRSYSKVRDKGGSDLNWIAESLCRGFRELITYKGSCPKFRCKRNGRQGVSQNTCRAGWF